jgi:hypothetical protein
MYMEGTSSPQLDRNLVVNNLALGNSGYASGGIAIVVSASTHVTLTNTLVAHNTINSGLASGVHCVSGSCSLIHCTVVDNKFGENPGEGVRLSALGGTNVIWNSIIVGHSNGVIIDAGAPHQLNYNDYYDNVMDTVGASGGAGAHSLFIAPLFVNRAAGDYHLTVSSLLINAGDSLLSLPHDIEGDVRMLGPDIGADEYIGVRLYLPLLLKNYLAGPWD